MRGFLMCGVAMATIMIGPSAVADATADRAVLAERRWPTW